MNTDNEREFANGLGYLQGNGPEIRLHLFNLADEVDRLKAQRDGLVAVMEGLARLGNGDRYGNSDGNVVAQVALAKYAPTRSAQSTTQPADLSGNA